MNIFILSVNFNKQPLIISSTSQEEGKKLLENTVPTPPLQLDSWLKMTSPLHPLLQSLSLPRCFLNQHYIYLLQLHPELQLSLKKAALLVSFLALFKFKVPIFKSHMERERGTWGNNKRKNITRKERNTSSSSICNWFLQTIHFLVCQ